MSSFDFDFGDLVSEAVERAGLDPRGLTHTHLDSVDRSLKLLFVELETKGASAEYRMEFKTYELDADAGGVVLESDTIDVTKASLLIDGKPIPLGRSTREDFLDLSFPEASGTPSIYFLMKSDPDNEDELPEGVAAPPATVNTPILVVWPQNGLTGDVSIRVTRLRQHVMPTSFGDTLDTRRNWLPTLTAGLASKLALKWNPELYGLLKGEYMEELMGRSADEDRHPVTIGRRGFGFGRARRH